ncbi:VCBS repeat-containing protein [Pontibacter sp. 13R65]|uniref:FG-GAP repeat domain-containing protein n=1 Tax=Pontibacter sp. 13R65 TaxID=3127458 RepID=UPI00301C22D3
MKKAFPLTVFALAAATSIGICQIIGFSPAQSYQVSEPFRNLVVKDVDNDGSPDIVGNGNINTVSSRIFGVLRNLGQGAFEQEQLFNSLEGDKIQDVGDFDGDGYPDVLCSTYWGNGVALYFGNPQGGYENRLFAPTAVHGQVAAFADLNNDGLQDLLNITTGSGQPNRLHILYGNQQRSLQQKTSYETNTASARYLLSLDLNQDGRLDIAAPVSANYFLVFMQQPDGSFTHHTVELYSVMFERGISFWDYNNDKYPDLVTAHFEHDSITVRLNNGNGHFAAKPALTLQVPHPVQPIIADLDNDNQLDILFASSADGAWGNELYVVRNNGNGSYSNPVLVATTEQLAIYQLADLNQDGYLDLVLSQAQEPQVHVFLNKATPTHVPAPADNTFLRLSATAANKVVLTPDQELKNLQLLVLDLQGKVIFKSSYAHVAAPIEIAWPYSSGIYIVKASTATEQNTIRFFLP